MMDNVILIILAVIALIMLWVDSINPQKGGKR